MQSAFKRNSKVFPEDLICGSKSPREYPLSACQRTRGEAGSGPGESRSILKPLIRDVHQGVPCATTTRHFVFVLSNAEEPGRTADTKKSPKASEINFSGGDCQRSLSVHTPS